MCHDGENRASPMNETFRVRAPSGEAGGNSAVCRQTAVQYTHLKKDSKTRPVSEYPTWLNQKMLSSEKGLTRKIQPENAVYMYHIRNTLLFGMIVEY